MLYHDSGNETLTSWYNIALLLQGRLADSYPEHSLPLRKRVSYVGVSPPAPSIKSVYRENISPPAPCLLRPGGGFTNNIIIWSL